VLALAVGTLPDRPRLEPLFDHVRTAALRTFPDRRIGKLLDLFEFVFALLALVFVKRHLKTPSMVRVCDVILAESRLADAILSAGKQTHDRAEKTGHALRGGDSDWQSGRHFLSCCAGIERSRPDCLRGHASHGQAAASLRDRQAHGQLSRTQRSCSRRGIGDEAYRGAECCPGFRCGHAGDFRSGGGRLL